MIVYPFSKRILFILFILIFCFKIAYAFYLLHLTSCNDPKIQISTWAISSGDTFSYTEAMENYIQKGSYFFYNGKENTYAGRLPHYSMPYWVFRQFLDVPSSYNALTIFQLFIEVFSVLVAFLFCFGITGNKIISLLFLGVLTLSPNWTSFSIAASPESLSCSFCVLFAFTYFLYLKSNRTSHLLLAGLLLAILVTLKPYFSIIFFVIGLQWLLQNRLTLVGLKKTTTTSFFIALPLVVILSPWIIRNYFVFQKIIPFQQSVTAGYYYSSAELAYRKYLMAWGGNYIFWEKSAAGCYFMPTGQACEFKMPNYVYTKSYDSLKIENVRKSFIELQRHYSDSLNDQLTVEFEKLTADFKSQKPFRFYLLTPINLFGTFIFHSGSYYLPIHSANPCFKFYQYLIKLFQSAAYWASLLIGIPGLIILSVRNKDYTIVSLGGFIFLFFPLILRATEWRYTRTVEPLLYLGIFTVVNIGYNWFKQRRKV